MRARRDDRLTIALVLSLILHLLLVLGVGRIWVIPEGPTAPREPLVIDLTAPAPEEEERPEVDPEDPLQPQDPEKEQRRPLADGQIVELPEPDKIEEPEEAEYLAAHSRKVEEETRAERFKINPEVLAPTYSEDAAQQKSQQLQDLGMTKPSTGATPGAQPRDPSQAKPGEAPDEEPPDPNQVHKRPEVGQTDAPEERVALYPDRLSRWAMTNLEGSQDPTVGNPLASPLRGAPQNDYLREKVGEATMLNSREFLYADYFNKIRRLVNYWWSQNLDNIGPADIDQPLRRPSYRTNVIPTLDAQGRLVSVALVKGCGVTAFDRAVTEAWKSASPFPAPPEGLVVGGQAELIRFDFILELSQGQSQYSAIDPRANVRFPGIAWPR